jgi:DNA-binding MarR family transcriptional regulator
MTNTNLYLDYLLRCEQKQALISRSCAHISSKLMALFVVLALKQEQGQPMTVSDTMALQDLASSAALHQRIDDLREAGMICVVYKGTDRRTKYLVPTEKGDHYLKLMGELLRGRL